jgi:UDP-sulfoquinovose synthase
VAEGIEMNILILGIDGYLGWPLAIHLAQRGHVISGVDKFYRRMWVKDMGSDSIIPVSPMYDRKDAFIEHFGGSLTFSEIDIANDRETLGHFVQSVEPDAIVHLAECPSAPYSMSTPGRAAFVMRNNVIGTLNLLHVMRDYAPTAHLVKLGTMGEYGTPNVDIPEGFFDVMFRGREATFAFPRKAGSWYHWSKVHDSMNVMWACEIWGLRSTDIMQGVVYGTKIDGMGDDDRLRTRFDIDEAFGTAINRFVAQAMVGHPLTIYGNVGKQTRGFLPLHDSMQCLTLVIEKPPEFGEYRVLNQFEETYSILHLAEKVTGAGLVQGLNVRAGHYEPPREESQDHYYNPDREGLIALGYEPDHDMHRVILDMMEDLLPYRDRIRAFSDVLIPRIHWSGEHYQSGLISERVFGSSSGKSQMPIG